VVRIGGDWHFTPGYLEKVEDEHLREKLAVYFEATDYKSILFMRIEDDEGLLGVMGFERREEASYDAAGFKFLQGFCKASSGALRRAGRFEGLPGISLVRKAQSIRERALGPRRVRFFLKSAFVAAAILLLVFGKWNLRVKGDCRITPYLATRAVAGQSGTVVDILKTERDSVKKAETIALLDDRDITNAIRETVLKINLQKARINALAATDPPAANLARMQLEILQIQLERQNIQKDMLKIKSPADGVIVTPREMINASLNAAMRAGEPLCEIADTSKLYLEVQINDRDIGLVKPGQEIHFRLAGAPNVPLACRVLDISPSTRPVPGKNVFVVRGLLEDPGKEHGLMHFLNLSGSAAISTGKRPLLYIIFRSTLERLRIIFL
ncbi:MAG: efflux RND transporter periplasmic adaptor subunit, partial [Planctomycetes bacterium]|nr:efflux RND transporter periplasmic adaptor subunit [Planctomycetota bacterium]